MDSHQEACQRQHRVLGHFLAVQSWLRGLDCVVLVRHDLEVFLGLERFKKTRVNWLLEDLEPRFPHKQAYYSSASPSSLHSLFLARVPINIWLSDDSMTTEERIESMSVDAPKTDLFLSRHVKSHRRLKETDVVKYLAILDSGLSMPTALSSVPHNFP